MRGIGMITVVLALGLLAGCRARGGEPETQHVKAGTGPVPAGESGKQATPAPVVRPPAVAGGFYPSSPKALREMIEAFLARVPDLDAGGQIVAAMAPHAGYVYSGQVAAYTHRLLQTASFDTIVIIGHDAYRGAVAFVCPVDAFETPLGRVPVDRDMVARLQAYHRGIVADRAIHAREHTVEVQLPFLQVSGRKFKVVPILFGVPTLDNARILASAIRDAAGDKKVMVLASTDMSHYPTYEDANKLDRATLDVLSGFDSRKLFAHLRGVESSGRVGNLKTGMCASGGVLTAIEYARTAGADRVKVLTYANSGDVPVGDKGRVVGYGAAVFVKSARGAD